MASCCFFFLFFFCKILDLASINAFVLYKETGDKISRREFVFKLATKLRQDYVVERRAKEHPDLKKHRVEPQKQT